MTGEAGEVGIADVEQGSTVADVAADAAKWRERGQQAQMARQKRTIGHFAHTAANISPTRGSQENPQLAFYSVDEVAERLNVCSKTIRNWIRDGRLPAHRPGKKLAIAKSELADFVARSRTFQR